MPEIRIVAGSGTRLQEMGPVIQGTLTHSEVQKEIRKKDGREVNSAKGKVLLDTGADKTSIDESTAKKLGLVVVDRGTLNSASHRDVPIDVFEGQVIINGFAFHLGRAGGTNLKDQGLIALIGRDILSRGKLEYDGRTGIVKFKFL